MANEGGGAMAVEQHVIPYGAAAGGAHQLARGDLQHARMSRVPVHAGEQRDETAERVWGGVCAAAHVMEKWMEVTSSPTTTAAAPRRKEGVMRRSQ